MTNNVLEIPFHWYDRLKILSSLQAGATFDDLAAYTGCKPWILRRVIAHTIRGYYGKIQKKGPDQIS
jgi:hypothetical protein